jgi:CAAX prenyl protease-like protein
VAFGAAAFAIWLALMPAGSTSDHWPRELVGSSLWAPAWLLMRVLGYVVTVPIAEELAFRGFLTRRLLRADFYNIPVGAWSCIPFLLSSLLFGALHGRFWLPGTIAGMFFAVALYRRRVLGDAVLAHATTNGLLVLYVFVTGEWSAWS